MNIERKTLGILALAAAAVLMAGCDKKDDKAATPAAPSTSAPASSSSTTPPAATTPAPSSSAATPAECEAYVAKVNACMDKLGNGNPAVASFKQQMEAAKAQWAAVTDKTQLAAQCKQASDLFAQSATRWAARNDVGRGCREAARFLLCFVGGHRMRSALLRRIRAGPARPIAPCPRRWAQSVRTHYTGASQATTRSTAMNSRTQWMEDIQKNISDLIARSPAADVEKNVRAMMAQAFTKMDLVTREEFDVQADLLARTRARVDQLAAQVQQLEERLSALSK